MASPQKENGFTPIANEIIEALCKVNLSPYESRIFLVPDTIRTWEHRGRLHAQRTEGGIRLFTRLDVDRLAAERKKLRVQALHHHGDSNEPP